MGNQAHSVAAPQASEHAGPDRRVTRIEGVENKDNESTLGAVELVSRDAVFGIHVRRDKLETVELTGKVDETFFSFPKKYTSPPGRANSEK